MGYVVDAILVIAKAEDGSLHHLYRGTPIPGNIPRDEVKRLADEGFLKKAAEPDEDPEEPADPGKPDEVKKLGLAEARDRAAELGIDTTGMKVADIRTAIEQAASKS